MADDGSSSDIGIPSMLMFKQDADPIKEELKANRMVLIEMGWSLPQSGATVEYSLWTTPMDAVSRDFLRQFKKAAIALGSHARFTPHLYMYNGLKSGCQGIDGENQCYNLCTNNGRYCATDPDNDLDRGISGADVVTESLRRICIWKNYGESDGIGVQWWDYVTEFMDRCSNADFFSNKDCIKDAYKHAKVDADVVDSCMRNSGGLSADAPNALLDLSIQSQTESGVVILPSAYVNGAPIRGSLTVNNIFDAVCAGFAVGTAPKICTKCQVCDDPSDCINGGSGGVCTIVANGKSSAGVTTHSFVSAMLFIIACFSGLGVWHYKRTREDMRDQVRGILADYMPLDDQDEKRGGVSMISNPGNFAR